MAGRALAASKKPTIELLPLEEQIRQRAYAIYLEHGQDGSEVDDWLEAEQEILSKQTVATSAAGA
jgi:hypothetical protein